MKKVYSISINGKNDCVILDEEEAALIKLKYMPNIRMYDMTKLHFFSGHTNFSKRYNWHNEKQFSNQIDLSPLNLNHIFYILDF